MSPMHYDATSNKAYPDFRDGTEACAHVDDPDIFFPEYTAAAGPAVMICRHCPLRAPCLEWALATDQRFGIWGATTPRKRTRMRKERDLR